MLLHVLPLLVRGPGVLKAQVMDGFFHVAHIFQVVDLDVNLIVGRIGVLDLGHLVVGILDHFQVLHAHDNAALGPPTLGGILLQLAHHFQFPGLGLGVDVVAVGDGQGHFVLVDVHKWRQLVAVGIGLALPAVTLGAVIAAAAVVKIVAGVLTDQDRDFFGLRIDDGRVQPPAGFQCKAHRLQSHRIQRCNVANVRYIPAIAPG